MVKLKKMIFNKLELLQNVSMVIAQSRFDRKKFPIVIITINEKEDMNFSDNNKYYCYTPGIKMMEYTKEEIEELFNNGSFSYLDNTKPRVPNIKISNNKRGEKNDSRTKR
jgi:TATA-box binding protein (TBP) (component of TFIID and TFIIIB)